MFEHSIPVPRLYKTAAQILRKVKNEGASLKGLVMENKFRNIKAIYALVVETLQRQADIDYLLKKSKLLEKEPSFEPWLARILITELLWRKNNLSGDSKPIKTMLSYKQILFALSNELHKDIKPKVEKPRYVRVNALKLFINEAVDLFRDEGWILSKFNNPSDYEGFLEKLANLTEEEFMVDFHIKDLLIFPKKTQFYNHPAYLNNSVILQDKASCLPARILNPPPGSIVLDMCAAPGMKTTQLAAIMEDNGTIFAVERDMNRAKILKSMVENSGATCINVLNKDVLTIFDKEVPGVEYILVDPSCTGSGMVDRVQTEKDTNNPERIKKLAGFQIKILKHALRSFPDCKRIVYSTCSVYPEENEEVVREAISSNTKFKLVSAKDLLDGPWLNFGSSEYGDLGKLCMYSKPEIDMTNGFFVAVFERLQEGEENVFYNISNSYDPTKDKTKRWVENEAADEANIEQTEDSNDIGNEKQVDNGLEGIGEKKKRKKKKDKCDEDESVQEKDIGNEEVENGFEEMGEKRKKKKKKDKGGEDETVQENDIANEKEVDNGLEEISKKRKKKRKTDKCGEDEAVQENCIESGKRIDNGLEGISEKNKKKRKKDKCGEDETLQENDIETEKQVGSRLEEMSEKRKKKKKKDECGEDGTVQENDIGNEKQVENGLEVSEKKKKKKNKGGEEETVQENDIGNEKQVESGLEVSEKRKKKKKKDKGIGKSGEDKAVPDNEEKLCSEELMNSNENTNTNLKCADKKKRIVNEESILENDDSHIEESGHKRKKKKRNNEVNDEAMKVDADIVKTKNNSKDVMENEGEACEGKAKKRKKKKVVENSIE